ncbi:MAG: hypothetical protein K2J65_03660 [Duncaniella sp.]|nr:hypothetical protein [Duncaniella sp.]
MNLRHPSLTRKPNTLKIFLPLVLAVMTLTFQSCSPDDDFRDTTVINLTSVTWFADVSYPDFYSAEYWDFFPDGTGEYELYTEYPDGSYSDIIYPFIWEFSDPSFSAIAINVQGYEWEYWILDRLTPRQLGVYISNSDPAYYPDIDAYYQQFTAL